MSFYAVWRETVEAVHRRSKQPCAVHSQVSGTGGEATETQRCGVLISIYIIAITAEAMSGALAAGRRNMDLFGVVVIAFLTALGGGTVRDILLGNFPVSWTQHPSYIYLTIIAGLVTVMIARFMRHLHQLFLVLDAVGLVTFTVIGCNVALNLEYQSTVVIMSGITTGIFGGIIRDIMCNRTPLVLRQELYASVALVVASLYLWLLSLGIEEDIILLATFSLGLLLRMIAIRWRIALPVFSYLRTNWD